MSEKLDKLLAEALKQTERARWLTRQSKLVVSQARLGRQLRKSALALKRSEQTLARTQLPKRKPV